MTDGLQPLRPGLWMLPIPLPEGHPLVFSNCYLFLDDDHAIHVVDPGTDTDANWSLLSSALDELGAGTARVRTIVATHLHGDHLGMAGRLREETGAEFALHEADQRTIEQQLSGFFSVERLAGLLDEWQVPVEARPPLLGLDSRPSRPPVVADRVLTGGERLDIAGIEVDVIATPGHTAGSVCLRERRLGVVLTGDSVLPGVHPGLGLGAPTENNPLDDYLRSLDLLDTGDDPEALPGHGQRFHGLSQRISQHRTHHLKRNAEVAAALETEPEISTWDLASRLSWSAGWPNLTTRHRYAALRQTAMHRRFVRDHRRGEEPGG